MRVLEVAKKEVQRKYSDELKHLKQSVKEFKQRLLNEMITKEKEVKQLHLQHQLEKAQLEDHICLMQQKEKKMRKELQIVQTKYENERR